MRNRSFHGLALAAGRLFLAKEGLSVNQPVWDRRFCAKIATFCPKAGVFNILHYH
jgi:hypothetical protein